MLPVVHRSHRGGEGGSLGPPFGSIHIDNRDYPQIRWINIAQNGFPLEVLDNQVLSIQKRDFGAVQPLADDFVSAISLLDHYDSDGTVSCRDGISTCAPGSSTWMNTTTLS